MHSSPTSHGIEAKSAQRFFKIQKMAIRKNPDLDLVESDLLGIVGLKEDDNLGKYHPHNKHQMQGLFSISRELPLSNEPN